MQQGHPRHKQLSRARHEMYLHNRHKSLVGVTAIKNLFLAFGESVKTAGQKIQKAFGVINEQMSTPNTELNNVPIVDYDNFKVKGLGTDAF